MSGEISRIIKDVYNKKIEVRLNLDQLEGIQALIDRDQAQPILQDKTSAYLMYCSKCKHVVSKSDNFCSTCGQRLDTENIAL